MTNKFIQSWRGRMISPPADRKRKALIGLRVSSSELRKINLEIQKK
jgi:hypothetical protein